MTATQILLDGPRLEPLTGGPATGLVIFLHGYGSNGNDLIQLGRQFQQALPGVAFVAPHGHLSLGRTDQRAWFALSTPMTESQRWAGAVAAEPVINAFIDAERSRLGIAIAQVVLVGFSQGTIMSLHVALRREEPIGAIVGFSGMLAGPEYLDEIVSRPPVTLIHGDRDPVIPIDAMRASAAALTEAGVPVDTVVSRGVGHSIDMQGMYAALETIQRVLNPANQ
jgi:phospholipase/carboxylesterase